MIERQDAGPAREQEQQNRSPQDVVRPGVRIDEDLNDRDHAEQRQRGQPRAPRTSM
jgi:hypothetical protein